MKRLAALVALAAALALPAGAAAGDIYSAKGPEPFEISSR